MIKIKRKNFKQFGHFFDYELENDVLLHESEWNGECYITEDGHFTPIQRCKDEFGDYETIGFKYMP